MDFSSKSFILMTEEGEGEIYFYAVKSLQPGGSFIGSPTAYRAASRRQVSTQLYNPSIIGGLVSPANIGR